jgi:hypothetical protein
VFENGLNSSASISSLHGPWKMGKKKLCDQAASPALYCIAELLLE